MNKIKSTFLFSLPFIVIFFIWFYYPSWIYYEKLFGSIVTGKNFIEDLGTFGDAYGALNTLFTGLAFAGLIISIRLQSKELSETRAELKEQSDQFKKQTESLYRQTFEVTFFQLLNLYRDTVGNLRLPDNLCTSLVETRAKGSQVVSILSGRMVAQAESKIDISDLASREYHLFMDAYVEMYGDVFSTFMKTIEKILMFVSQSSLDKDGKLFYLSLLTAQMTKAEMSFLFYYGINRKGKYHHLYVTTGFLSSFELQDSVSVEAFLSYKMSAYGDFSSHFWDAPIGALLGECSDVGIVMHSTNRERMPLPKEISTFKKYAKNSINVRLIGYRNVVRQPR